MRRFLIAAAALISISSTASSWMMESAGLKTLALKSGDWTQVCKNTLL